MFFNRLEHSKNQSWQAPRDFTPVSDDDELTRLPPQAQHNILVYALLVTSLCVFTIGHLMLREPDVLRETAPITAVCLGILILFSALSKAMHSAAWALMLTYGLLIGLTYGHRGFFLTLLIIAIAVSALQFLRHLQFNRDILLGIASMGICASLVILDCDFSPFDVSQRLHAGAVHRDTLFHASIAAMIKNYGVTSTGLHGLVQTPYHSFSHALMAAISILSGASVIVVYGVAQWVLFAPLLIFTATYCVVSLAHLTERKMTLAWLLICAALAFLPWFVDRWTLVRHNPFISESYALAIGLLFCGLPVLCQRSWQKKDGALVIILAGMLGYAKASVGLVFLGLVGLRALLYSPQQKWTSWTTFLLAGAATVAATYQSARAAVSTGVEPAITVDLLSHIRRYAYLGEQIIRLPGSTEGVQNLTVRSIKLSALAVTTFFLTHFLFSWWVIIRGNNLVTQNSKWGKAGLIFTAGSLIFGALISIIFKLPEGTAYFFFNVAFYVALPFWTILALQDIETLSSWCHERVGLETRHLATGFILFALTLAMVTPLDFYRYRTDSDFTLRNDAFIEALSTLRNDTPLNVTLKLQTGYRKDTIFSDCSSRPFLYPALSERPWINLITPEDPCHYFFYGYPAYGISQQSNQITVAPRLPPGVRVEEYPRRNP